MARKKFAAGTYSDHMAVLRAFQNWQNARANGWERIFCEKHFISSAVMEMVVGMRTQLLGQLRASGFVRARGPGDIRDLNTNSENWAVIKASLTAGLYPNIIRVDREHFQLRTQCVYLKSHEFFQKRLLFSLKTFSFLEKRLKFTCIHRRQLEIFPDHQEQHQHKRVLLLSNHFLAIG